MRLTTLPRSFKTLRTIIVKKRAEKDIIQHIYIHKPTEATIYVGATDKKIGNKHFQISDTNIKWSYLQSKNYVDLPLEVQEGMNSGSARHVDWDEYKFKYETLSVIFQEEMLKFGIKI